MGGEPHRPLALTIFLAVAIIIVLADQATKLMVTQNIPHGGSVEIVNGFVNMVHARNPGAAFGLWSKGDSSYKSIFFLSVSVLVIAGLPFVLFFMMKITRLVVTAFGFFWGGAIGNFIDRIRFGEVIDFLDLHLYGYHWPAFNVADASLCMGAALIAVELFLYHPVE
jgi:signal peptidase II